ncbi:hypothetical protein ACLMAJ_28535 [Nocardia sp. KC 131]|uniref:hypothetical protein n=1 Tax=Nocardia arseniciresistens TaxID=3392119 RepID=UPI00398EA874
MRRTLVVLASTIGLLLTPALPAAAYPPVNIVHTERVQAGPYAITVGFSTWPIRATQSLDFTFTPDGGIAGKSGVLEVVGPEAEQSEPLARHPRKREVWGLDVESLPAPGNWSMRFTVDGPDGRGTGELRDLNVLEQPGPPMSLSWAVSTVPLLGLIALVVVAWRRTRTPTTG